MKIENIDLNYGFGHVLMTLKDGTKILCKEQFLIESLLNEKSKTKVHGSARTACDKSIRSETSQS